MKALLLSAWQRLAQTTERRATEKTRRQLLELDDRTLADIGVSRPQLELGSAAWPWTLEDHGIEASASSPPVGPAAGAIEAITVVRETAPDAAFDRAA